MKREEKLFLSFAFLVFQTGLNAYVPHFGNVHTEFHRGMKNMGIDKSKYIPAWKWKHVQNLYEDAIKELHYSEELCIPKYIHHVWLGSPLPEYVKNFRKTWIDCCDDWTFILWTDHPSKEYGEVISSSFAQLKEYLKQPNRFRFIVMDMTKVKFYNQTAIFGRARNYGEKSDIIRYEILYRFGGLYVDTDFECLRTFEDLHHCFEFYVGIAYDPNFALLNGLIGAKPYHPIMAEAVMRLHDKSINGQTMAYSGPYFLTDVFFDVAHVLDRKSVALPLSYFYPMPAVLKGTIERWIEPETYAVHHWKVSWLSN